jgi:predicted nucleic acid-binding protein
VVERAERLAVQIAHRYADLGVGLADASLAALAARLDTADIATFDERHFRAMRPENAATAFRLLPADA